MPDVYSRRFNGELTISDATGTPIVVTVGLFTEFTIENGKYDKTWVKDSKGDFASGYPPMRGDAQPSRMTFKVKQTGLPGTGTMAIPDFAHQSGQYSSLTSSLVGSTPGGATPGSIPAYEKTFEVQITQTDGTNTATYTLTNACVSASPSAWGEENTFDFECEANQPFVTVSYA